jgi:adenylate/nucleoside-diphosphate kinase
LTGETTFPIDVNTKPCVFIVGYSHSGKTSLAKLMEAKLGLVRLKISTILSEFLTEIDNLNNKNALSCLKRGG